MKNIKIFIDSDVVVSSLLSKTGAAYLLINSNYPITKYVSNLSILELETVIIKLNITKKTLNKAVSNLEVIKLKESAKKIKEKYSGYVNDKNDAHVIAGTVETKAKFLITYNTKDYRTNKLKTDHNAIVMPPGSFLQYLRVIVTI